MSEKKIEVAGTTDTLRTFLGDEEYNKSIAALMQADDTKLSSYIIQKLILTSRDAKLGRLTAQLIRGELHLYMLTASAVDETDIPLPYAAILFLEDRLRGLKGFTAEKLLSSTIIQEQRVEALPRRRGLFGFLGRR